VLEAAACVRELGADAPLAALVEKCVMRCIEGKQHEVDATNKLMLELKVCMCVL
jgi:hypothetical protein